MLFGASRLLSDEAEPLVRRELALQVLARGTWNAARTVLMATAMASVAVGSFTVVLPGAARAVAAGPTASAAAAAPAARRRQTEPRTTGLRATSSLPGQPVWSMVGSVDDSGSSFTGR